MGNTEPKTTSKINKEDNGTQTEHEIDIKFEKEIISKDETNDKMTLHDEKFVLDKETDMKTSEIKIFNEPNKMKILYDQRKLNEQEKKIGIYKTNNCFSTNMLFVFISVVCVVFASLSGSYPQTNIKENTEFSNMNNIKEDITWNKDFENEDIQKVFQNGKNEFICSFRDITFAEEETCSEIETCPQAENFLEHSSLIATTENFNPDIICFDDKNKNVNAKTSFFNLPTLVKKMIKGLLTLKMKTTEQFYL